MLCCRSIFLHRCRCCITGVYSYIDVVLQEYILTYMLLLYYRSIFLHRCRCCVAGVYSYIDVLVLQKYILTQMSLLCCRSINVQNYRSVTVAWSLAAVPCSDSLLQLIPPNPSNPNPSPPQITLPAQPPYPWVCKQWRWKKAATLHSLRPACVKLISLAHGKARHLISAHQTSAAAGCTCVWSG